MLPHEPEALAALQARLPQALETIYDPELCEKGLQATPGTLRRHVFDYADGLRLIVSCDWIEQRPVLHVSASLEPDTPLYADLLRRLRTQPMRRVAHRYFIPLVEQRWRELGRTPLYFHFLSPEKGVPHWFGERLAT